jgi:dTMP kinase
MVATSEGILIAIDGIDGAGKTTQLKLLAEGLLNAGEVVTASKEPTDGPWGRKLRQSAQDGRLSLNDEIRAFVEDRKEHVASLILPALARGEIVLLDRYYYSTIAYQGARGGDISAIAKEMVEIAPTPDVAFLIDIDPRTAIERISLSRGEVPNEFERADSLAEVRSIFRSLGESSDEVRIIDGRHSIGHVYATILRLIVDGVLKTKRCAKSYDCDVFYCTPRMTGDCPWFEVQRSLKNSIPPAASTAVIK